MFDQMRSSRHRLDAVWFYANKRKEKNSDLYLIYIDFNKTLAGYQEKFFCGT